MNQGLRSPEQRLHALGLKLPPAAAPVANYIAVSKMGGLLVVSGQLPFGADGKIDPRHLGKLGLGVSAEDGRAAARACALNILAQANAALGNLDRIAQVLRLTGYVASTPDSGDQPQVVNGASDLMVAVLGDAGRHTRVAVGVAALPARCAVEIDAIIAIKR